LVGADRDLPLKQGDPVSSYDLVLHGGRVIDPASSTDGIFDVGINGSTVAAVSTTPLEGRRVIDVANRVVAPGFIDMHSHCFGIAGLRLQALDGITTALELELGVHPVDLAYQRAALEGRPINYGFAAGWAAARLHVKTGRTLSGHPADGLIAMGVPEWQAEASPHEISRILELLQADLANGALGIGVVLGYAPRVAPAEYTAVARLAAERGVPTYTHARDLVEQDPATSIDGAEEIMRAAGETGAHMHYCHVNSTSLRHLDRVLGVVERARAHGARVSTEAYPYGSGMTTINAAFLDPSVLQRRGITPDAIRDVATGRRFDRAEDLAEARQTNRGDLVFVEFLPEDVSTTWELLTRALVFPDTAIATDGFEPQSGSTSCDDQWPLPADAVTHPRTAGTYSRSIRKLWRESGALSLMEVIRRSSLVPSQILAESVPAMSRKGRVRTGDDADIVVFDPDTVTDQATYTDTTAPSTGFDYVIVNGVELVSEGRLRTEQLPGQPIRAESL
jgi:N-acyl-D-aspartate/D-glutamate deacylase